MNADDATAMLLPPHGPPEYLSEPIEWRMLQRHVGGVFACVTLSYANGDLSVWVHDEGLLIGLPLNGRASVLAGQFLVGPAVITGGTDDAGNTLPLPPGIGHRLTLLLAAVDEALGGAE